MDNIKVEEMKVLPSAEDKRSLKINYAVLFFGRSVTSLSAMIFSFAISLYILDITGSALTFSISLGVSLLPGIIVNIFGGFFVDKYNKKSIMISCDIIGGISAIIFLIIFIFHPKNIFILVFYSAIYSIIHSFFSLAITASIPELVTKENTARTNSIIQAIGAFSNFAGPIIGAVAYKLLGLKLIFLINGSALLFTGFLELFLIYEYVMDKKLIGKGYWDDMKNIFQYLNANRILAFFFIFAAIINMLYNPLLFVVIRYITYQIMKVSEVQVSYIQAAAALGVIIGALFISMKKTLNGILIKKFIILFQIQAFLIILWIFPLFSIFHDEGKWLITAIFCILLTFYGLLNTFQNIPVITYFQLNVPVNLRAKLFGFFMSAVFITTPFGMWLYGILLQYSRWEYVIMLSGILMLALSIMASRNRYFKEFIGNVNFKK